MGVSVVWMWASQKVMCSGCVKHHLDIVTFRSGIRLRVKQSACVSMDWTPAIILLIICHEGAHGCRKRNVASSVVEKLIYRAVRVHLNIIVY